MQNDEYTKAYEKELRKMLGEKVEITEEEKIELKLELLKQEYNKGRVK